MKPPYDLKKCERPDCGKFVPFERNGKRLRKNEYELRRFCCAECDYLMRSEKRRSNSDPMEYNPDDPNCADLPSPTEIAERALQVRRMRELGAVS